ncbi:MAG: ankyrin repeat domain-containing protein [Rubrivivax sp.]
MEASNRARRSTRLSGLLRWAKRLLQGILAVLALSGMAMVPSAEQFFSGRYLELARALQAKDFAKARELAQGLDLEVPGRKGMTLMWFAIANKNFPAVSLLVTLGSRPDEQVVQGLGSPLNAALESRELDLLTALLDGGLSPVHTHPQRKLLLQRAVLSGTPSHVKLLLDRGADVNQRDSVGGSALTEAISTVQPELALMLVERGANISLPKVNGVTPAWAVQLALQDQVPASELAVKFARLRDAMAQRGAKFPALSPAQMRQQMKAQGLPVAE